MTRKPPLAPEDDQTRPIEERLARIEKRLDEIAGLDRLELEDEG